MVGGGSRPVPRAVVTYTCSASDDITVDNSIIMKHIPKQQYGSSSKSALKKHPNNSEQKKSFRSSPKRRVSFDEQLTLALVKRIPQKCSKDCWYSAGELVDFRAKVLEIKELNLKAKLKSARSRNHSRRVLLQYRTDRANIHMSTSRSMVMRSHINLKNVSKMSSEKTTEVAIKNAKKLEREIHADQSGLNPAISSVCFGPSQHWAIDYYLASMIDTLCTVAVE